MTIKCLGLTSLADIACIQTDSRQVKPGDIFVAINTGHAYIQQALSLGAKLVIAEQAGPHIHHVVDTKIWLADVAKYYRHQLCAKVIGVTGSVGKTTLVQHLKQVLKQFGKVYATVGNQNNEIGCALTLLNAPIDVDYLVVEMGISQPFDMDFLVDMVNPDIALLTCIGFTHLAALESTHGVWSEKIKIAMPNTKLFCMQDQPWIKQAHHPISLVSYSDHCVHVDEQKYTQVGVIDEIEKVTMMGVTAVLHQLGIKDYQWQKQSVFKRAVVVKHHKGATWINDTYNASLLAYHYAMKSLAQYQNKRVLLAGEMGGLGIHTSKVHRYFAKLLNQVDLDMVIFYGKAMQEVFWRYQGEAIYVENANQLDDILEDYSTKEYTVWLKGSRHLALENYICLL